MTHKDLPYLHHIMDAILEIERSVGNLSEDQFLKDKDKKDANVRRLEVIGEAVKNLSKEFRERNKEIEWSKIAGTRDRIIHKYFEISWEIVWNIIKNDLPKLKEQMENILKTYEQ